MVQKRERSLVSEGWASKVKNLKAMRSTLEYKSGPTLFFLSAFRLLCSGGGGGGGRARSNRGMHTHTHTEVTLSHCYHG